MSNAAVHAGTSPLTRIDLAGCREPDAPRDDDGTRQRLLTASIELFAARGYEACTMRHIGQAVGLGAPAIYNHFKSKTELLVAALDAQLSQFMVAVLHQAPDAPAEELLFELLRRQVVFRLENSKLNRANDMLLDAAFTSRVLPHEDAARLTAALSEYTHIIGELIEDVSGRDPLVETSVRTLAVLNLVNSAGYWYRPGGRLSPDEIAEQCLVLVRRTIAH